MPEGENGNWRLRFHQGPDISITIDYDLQTLAATMVVVTQRDNGDVMTETTPCKMAAPPDMNMTGFDISMRPVGPTSRSIVRAHDPGSGDAATEEEAGGVG